MQVTALEIRALKRVNKGTRVLLLDKNGGGQAKNVAKELNKLGFRKIYIVAGGFSGWAASKLQVRKPVRSACCKLYAMRSWLRCVGFGALPRRAAQPVCVSWTRCFAAALAAAG